MRVCYVFFALCGVLVPNTVRAEGTRAEKKADLAGFNAAALARVDSVIERAVRDGATPGAALAVGRAGRLVRLRGYGHLGWDPNSPAVTDSTLYDLASLTKAIGTTTVALQLIYEGKLGLEDPISKHLKFWPSKGRQGRIRVRHLLQHTSGLPAGVELWERRGTRDARLARLAKLRMTHEPGKTRVYSDVGMILLGAILEKVAGDRLDKLFAEHLVSPLELNETMFNPLGSFARDRIAPTEYDRDRGSALQGRVHDPNAQALAGVAGHAGLFSSARDLATIAAALLDAARNRPNGLFETNAFALALNQRAFGRPLGWDVPTGASSAGEYFSMESFGHTGFTGTSIWIDPDQDLFVVLLTNRVHPSATNQRHLALRRDVHDAIQTAIAGPAPDYVEWSPLHTIPVLPMIEAVVLPTRGRGPWAEIAGVLLLLTAAQRARRTQLRREPRQDD